MTTNIPQATGGATYEGQLAERVGELLPDLNAGERLELLGAMDPDDMSTSLAFIAAMYPQVFDFAIVRDRALAQRLTTRLAEAEDEGLDDEEPFCSTCGSPVGIFRGHGPAWHHFRGEGTAASPVELYDADHEPEVAWRPGRCPVSYVYIRSEPQLWTVGFYAPDGKWHPESDHGSSEEAAERVVLLNGGLVEDTKRLGRIRVVLARFDWENDDRQLALEAIERIVDGGQA
jgi:hypothetical protein